MGERKSFRPRGKAWKVIEIIGELSEIYGNYIPVTLIIDKASELGVKEPDKVLKELRKESAIVYTSPTTIAKTWPSV